jgi:hypothetical protein
MSSTPPDFTDTVGEGMNDFEADPYDFGNHLRQQQDVAAGGGGSDGDDLQTSVMAAIVRAASDMHSVRPLKFNIAVDMKAEEQLKASSAQIKVGLNQSHAKRRRPSRRARSEPLKQDPGMAQDPTDEHARLERKRG